MMWSDQGLLGTVAGRFLPLSFHLQSHLVWRGLLVSWRRTGEPVGVVEPRHDGVRPGPSPGPGLESPRPCQAAQRVQPGPDGGLVQTPATTQAASYHGQQAADRRGFSQDYNYLTTNRAVSLRHVR